MMDERMPICGQCKMSLSDCSLRIAIDFLSSVVKIIEDDRRNRKNGGRDNADPD